MSTFTYPLNTVGTGDKQGSNAAVGHVVSMQTAEVAFGDTTVSTIVLPENVQVLDFTVDVTTVFNAATTNTLDIGTTATADLFAADLDLETAGRVLASSDASQLANFSQTNTDALTVVLTYSQTGTAATAGAARVTVTYAVPAVLPA